MLSRTVAVKACVVLILFASSVALGGNAANKELAWVLTFPDPDIRKSVRVVTNENARVLDRERYEGTRVLRISGVGKDDTYGMWIHDVTVSGGKHYGLSVFSKVTTAFPKASEPILMVFFYKDQAKKQRTGIKYVRLRKTPEWLLTYERIQVPNETKYVSIGFRLSGFVPRSEGADFAKFEFAKIGDPYVGVPLIDFEGWTKHPRRDVTVVPPNARVRATTIGTGEAHSGEWYLEVEGINHSTQYGLYLKDVWVRPRTRYNLSLFARMTPNFMPRTLIVMILQYDAKGERVGKSDYWYPFTSLPSKWTGAEHVVLSDENARTVTILFRLEHVLPGNKLFLDDIEFKPAEPAVLLDWEIDPKTARLAGTVRPTGDIAGLTKRITVSITRENQPVKQHILTGRGTGFTFDLKDLTDNVKYYVVAEALLADGRKIRCKVTDKDNLFYTFVRERPWEGHTLGVLGKNDPPPSPWRPVSYDPETNGVGTWNNTFALGRGLGSLRIGFQSPAQRLDDVALYMNGKPLADAFGFSPAKATYASPNKVAVESSGRSEQMQVQTGLTVDFDGFIRQRIVLRPHKGQPFRLKSLTLKIGFPKSYVRYSYKHDGLTFDPSWRSDEFHPVFWFGNFDTGLLWCANRIYPSTRKQQSAWISLDDNAGKKTLTINLVNAPMRIEGPLEVEFGLLPTPTRPFQPRTRNVRFRSGKDAVLDVCGTMPNNVVKYFGYPEVTSLGDFERLTSKRGMPKAATLFYFATSYAMETIPQMTYFKKEWINVPTHRYTTQDPSYQKYATGDYTTVDMGNSSWTDLCLYKFKEFLELTGIKGIYNDSAYPYIREKDGECSCPVFEARELHKRSYVLLHQIAPDGWIISHQGRSTALPYAAFSDFVMNGEHLREALREYTYYLEFMSLQEFRAMVASPLGPAHLLLSQYWQKEKADNRALMAQVSGLAMLHDAKMWVAGQEVLLQMMRERINFGDLSKTSWYPYWGDNPYLRIDSKDVVMSFYERQGDLFVIMFNAADKRTETTLHFDGYLKKFAGDRHMKVYDPVTDKAETQDIARGRIELTFEPYVPKLLTLIRSAPRAKH